MRILMLTYEIVHRGGSFIRCHSLAKNLAALGHEITLMAAARQPLISPRTTTMDGVSVVEVPDILPARLRHAGLSPIEVLTRNGYLHDRKFDLVHGFGHRPTVSVVARAYRRKTGVPY